MNHRLSIAAFLGAFALAGCASTDPKAATAPGDSSGPGEAVTGSRIPTRASSTQPVQKVDKEDWNRSQSVIGNAPRGN